MKKSVLVGLVREQLAKKQTLKENSLAGEINSVLPDNTSYSEFAKAVASILVDAYGKHNFKPFMEVLHKELGLEEGITENEGAAPPTGFRPQGDLNGILSATIVDGGMVRLTAREEGSGFNKRVTSPAAVSIEEFTPEFVTKAFSTIYQPSEQDRAGIEAFVQQVQDGHKAHTEYNG
jgi:hypothetical protein